MPTYHLHITGIVQGVGFRPFVFKLATAMDLKGWVNNTSDGVHIHINADHDVVTQFSHRILSEKPEVAIITGLDIREVKNTDYQQFDIIHSESSGTTNLLLTPDFGMCPDCQQELFDSSNKRYYYPFTTCTNCGPRYSIIQSLPYDRPTTTMTPFTMCPTCQSEYDDPLDRRYYSQTNSCPDCAIDLSFYESGQIKKIETSQEEINHIVGYWKQGKIVAIKGIGGFLLTGDATNSKTVSRLRQLKHRPSKPFALMYHDFFDLAEDVEVDAIAANELRAIHSPIVLLTTKADPMTALAFDDIAPNLGQLGVMMPYTPLYALLLQEFGRPIIATSGNISGSTIIYQDQKAIEALAPIADMIVFNNRDIVLPQDDSVIKFSTVKRQKITIRRSRGLAPSLLYPHKGHLSEKTILCMGASLKSTFSLLHSKNVFISQYLGDTAQLDAQESYKQSLNHLLAILDARPDTIVVDKHPAYFSTAYGEELSQKYGTKLQYVQHHHAHFWSVLAEHDLLFSKEKVLGVILDGTGYGDDRHIWGGEFLIFNKGTIHRQGHLDYFDFILGDKMPREPRISALAVVGHHDYLEKKFTPEEWKIYRNVLKSNTLKTSSAGRLFDAAASIILDKDIQSYEGEAAMLLEENAYKYFRKYGPTTYYSYISADELPKNLPKYLILKLIEDKEKGYDSDFLAAKFHISLAHYIFNYAKTLDVHRVAFSGGVFQNGWLVDLLKLLMEPEYTLYFQESLSPNDEGISFGQLMSIVAQSRNNVS